MADDNDVLADLDNLGGDGAAPGANGADTQPVAGIISQYVKDLSVENPKAPESFQWNEQPELDVQFNIQAREVNDEVTEVELKITVTNKCSQGTAYIVDLSYCGLVGMRNMPDDQKHAFTYAEAPRFLFPFADAVRDAGFQPLMLDPVDFQGLYLQQLQAKQQQEAGEAPAAN